MSTKPIIVVGHKNPDTDSICSAICYANLKNIIDKDNSYIPKRAGMISSETDFVLKRFGIHAPGYVDNLEPRVRDVSKRQTKGIDSEASLKRAYEQMKEESLRTLPVYTEGKLAGVITQGNIAQTMMEDYDSKALSRARVSCRNIIDTLDGELLVGDIDREFSEGPIAIGAANPEKMTQYIEPHSMVIMGNRSDAQISALEKGADWLIVCLGSDVFESIKELARDKGCNIIVTPHSTYMAARLINQSMPVRHVMYDGELVLFHEQDFVKDVKKTMTKLRLRYFPVLDASDKVVGLISQRNLLDMESQKVILVDHNENEQSPDGIEATTVLEIIDHHRIGGIKTPGPVYFRNEPLGCTSTIVARMYKENGVTPEPAYAGLMLSAILSDTLCFKSPTCTEVDKAIAKELADIAGVDTEKYGVEMLEAGSNLSGRSEEEIFYMDYKIFNVGSHTVGVSQVTIVGSKLQKDLKNRMKDYVAEAVLERHLDFACLMITDVLAEKTDLVFAGDEKKIDVKEVVTTAFNVKPKGNFVELPGVVSRKRQLIPGLTQALSAQ